MSGRNLVSSKTILAKKKRKIFLRILAETGKVTDASKAVGFLNTSTLQKARRADEDFAEEWDIALQAAANKLEAEAWRRAEEGVLEPTFYKGEIVGYTTKYSDALLMFVLRGLKPGTYRENAQGGDVNVNFGIAVLPMTAPDADQWQARALDMHDEQEVITIEEKPVENTLARITKRSD